MGISGYASRSTYKLFTVADAAGALTVASGGAIQVLGLVFTCTSTTDTVFTVTDASDNTLMVVAVPKPAVSSSVSVEIPFMADAGLKVQSSATNGSVTVFHNSPGN
jgi:hypothetical protein